MQTVATKSPEGFPASSDILMSPHGEEETFVRWPRFVGDPNARNFFCLFPSLSLSSADAEEGINDSLDLYPSFFRAVAPLHISSKEEGQAGLLDCQEEGGRRKGF